MAETDPTTLRADPSSALGQALRLPEIRNLIEGATYARNRLEMLCDAAWNGDARDFKRNLASVFAEYDAALAAIPQEENDTP